MDESLYGKRNKKGDWAPSNALGAPELWQWPPSAGGLLRWAMGFVWPWNALFLAISGLTWLMVLPEPSAMAELSWSWVLPLFAWNWTGLFAFYGVFEWALYRARRQATRFKYNGRFPADQASGVFWFKSQNLDNFLRSFVITVPIGTATEVLLLWLYGRGTLVTLEFSHHALALVLMVPLASFVHEVHFFFIHRAIHWGPLYRWVHSVHHNSINPSPWSSMSMHPVEGLLYFGVAFWLIAVPGHPFLAVHFFTIAAFGAIVGHIGFDRIELPGGASIQPSSYAHYLHHKHFEVNYCDNGSVPLDLWFGSWHDGSAAGEARMQRRYETKLARLQARERRS